MDDLQLKKLQKAILLITDEIDRICRKYNIKYSLVGGSMLGAIRHKGFIPWDDDMDVSMPRDDYNKAMKKLPELFASYGDDSLTLYVADDSRLGFGYEHMKTGVWCDVFPVDIVYAASDDIETVRKSLAGKIRSYKKFYASNSDKITSETLIEKRKAIINAGGG